MTGTVPLFRQDPYARSCEAAVTAVAPDGRVALDATVFYPQGGGQPGDVGRLRRGDLEIEVLDTGYGEDRATILHRLVPGDGALAPGDRVEAILDWPRRYARMRMHTALHLLSVALPYPVTGGAIGDGEGRLDFDCPQGGLDRDAIERQLSAFVAADAAVTERWITDAELDAEPGLVKTMKVKPPRGTGRVRLVSIAGIDLQPCGGTHVARTGEIGRVVVSGIEKKGRQNRRVRLALGEAGTGS